MNISGLSRGAFLPSHNSIGCSTLGSRSFNDGNKVAFSVKILALTDSSDDKESGVSTPGSIAIKEDGTSVSSTAKEDVQKAKTLQLRPRPVLRLNNPPQPPPRRENQHQRSEPRNGNAVKSFDRWQKPVGLNSVLSKAERVNNSDAKIGAGNTSAADSGPSGQNQARPTSGLIEVLKKAEEMERAVDESEPAGSLDKTGEDELSARLQSLTTNAIPPPATSVAEPVEDLSSKEAVLKAPPRLIISQPKATPSPAPVLSSPSLPTEEKPSTAEAAAQDVVASPPVQRPVVLRGPPLLRGPPVRRPAPPPPPPPAAPPRRLSRDGESGEERGRGGVRLEGGRGGVGGRSTGQEGTRGQIGSEAQGQGRGTGYSSGRGSDRGGFRGGMRGGGRIGAAPAGAPAAPVVQSPAAGVGVGRGGARGGAVDAKKWKGKAKGGPEEKELSSKESMAKRRQNRSTRKAAREEAAKASAPVAVDILEVGSQGLTVQELSQQLAVNDSDIVRCLFMRGVITTVTQRLDEETIRLVCSDYGVEVVGEDEERVEDMAKDKKEFLDEEDLDNLEVRPPVITIMGHVDHGKTSLLDFIRKSKIASQEAGGITQGIGAYRVKVPVGEDEPMCVFLDTPGHEAFSAMRARGALVTDIIILVVAADDGVRPQTQEAVAHAKAANVPVVVAINKIDKEGANPDRVIEQLAALNLVPEAWGGDVPMVPVSALTGQGVDDLLETVMLMAMVQDLRANPDREAVGTVIEASLDKQRGPMATLLVQNGTLRKGDVLLCGAAFGKARALTDDMGEKVDSAGPSTAVQVLGLSTVPVAGDEFRIVPSLEEGRELAEVRAGELRTERLAQRDGEGKVTLAAVASAVAANKDAGSLEQHCINVVLKVDAQGSLEAIRSALQGLPQNTVRLRFLLTAPGEITSSDVDLAQTSGSVLLGFNVPCSGALQSLATERGVELRTYRVIYDLIDDVRTAMEGKLSTKEERVPLGSAEVKAVFGAGSSRVAGCMVTEGKLVKGCRVVVKRGPKEIFNGVLGSLRRVKELAKEVGAGLECGVGVTGFDDWVQGDAIEAFTLLEKSLTLEEASKNTAEALSATEI